ncbi:MAG: OmpA family protein [Comamonas sp.]|nr:OmpA family protein [Comamonas sp.]
MRKSLTLLPVTAVLAAALALSGCSGTGGGMTDTQRNTAIGTGVGAVAGALISKGTGGKAGVGAAAGAVVGGIGTYIWSANMEKRKQEMQAATQGTGIDVSQTADNRLKLDIPSDVSFDTGRYDIKSNFAPILNQLAQGLRSTPNAVVHIVGHTDSTGSDAVNNPLSLNRANATRDYLAMRGANANSIYTEGRGSYEPIASNATADGRARNRRVEIFMGETQ